MTNSEYLESELKKKHTVYMLNTFENIVIKFVPLKVSYKCYAKFEGVEEYVIDKSTNLVIETEMGGDIINKAKYEKY